MKLDRAGDRQLQLPVIIEEFLVSTNYQPVLTTFLPFVHTTCWLLSIDWFSKIFGLVECLNCD